MKFTPHPFLARSLTLLAATAGLGLLNVQSSHAAVLLTGTVTFDLGTSLYSYSYSVSNTSLVDDAVLITVPVNVASNILGISAPVGFALTFDPSQGWVNINEDSSIITPQTFGPGSTVAPFTFNSAYGPSLVTYTAFDSSGTEFTGSVQAPNVAPIPEPTGAMFLALGLAVPTVLSRRRQHTA